MLADGNATIQLVYFRAQRDWLTKLFPIGARKIVSGKVEWFDMRPQLRHPDHVLDAGDADSLAPIEPVYRLTEGLSLKVLRRAISGALDRLPDLPEWLSPDLLAARGWPSFFDALQDVHHPKSVEFRRTRKPRLAAPRLRRAGGKPAGARADAGQPACAAAAPPWRAAGTLRARVEAALPFALTQSQQQAIGDIGHDLAGDTRMLRLLQGDVGSGKTVVALAAMAHVVEAGGQAALMAPTELLARQHFATIEPLANAAGLERGAPHRPAAPGGARRGA